MNPDDVDEVTRKKRQRSKVWAFFVYNPRTKKAVCCKCHVEYNSDCSNNLKKHIIKKHPLMAKKLEEMKEPIYARDKVRREIRELENENAIYTNYDNQETIIEDKDGYEMQEVEYLVNEEDNKEEIKTNKRTLRSSIWRFYKLHPRKPKAKCIGCNRNYKRESISNLKRHLERSHPKLFREYKKMDRDPTYISSLLLETKDCDVSAFSEDDSLNEDGDNSFPDDAENIKTLLGLKGAQVDRTIEIIETDSNVDPMSFQSEEGEIDNYDDDNYENDLIVKQIRAKPILRSCLKSIKQEPNEDVKVPIKHVPEDPIDVLVKNIEYKLRIMPDKQRMIAEYKIHEILFLGISEQLKLSHEENIAQTQKPDYSITVMDGQNPEEQIM